MIIFENKMFQTRSDKPNEDWTNGEAKFTVPDNSELANKMVRFYPYVEFVIDDNGNLVDIVEVEHKERPSQPDPVVKLQAENKTLKAQVAALSEQNEFQEDLIVELANIVYA